MAPAEPTRARNADDADALAADRHGAAHTDDVLVDNPLLRLFGYAGRVGRLAGTLASHGSRYAAYVSDVGEAFRPVADPRLVRLGYAVSWTYVLTDVALNTKRAKDAQRDYVRAGLHAAVFQSLGSMLFPALIIHQAVHQSERLLRSVGRASRFGPTALGLAVVPFLPYMVDHPVELAVDLVFDRFWPEKGRPAHGAAAAATTPDSAPDSTPDSSSSRSSPERNATKTKVE